MRTTLNIDEKLLEKVMGFTGEEKQEQGNVRVDEARRPKVVERWPLSP